jgi:hypothetical protein
MASLQFTENLLSDVLFRGGEWKPGQDITASEFYTIALAYLNRAYLGIAAGGGELIPGLREEWRWLKNTTPGVIQLWPVIAPGIGTAPESVNATFNQAGITFNGMIGEGIVNLTGWRLSIGEAGDIFRIASHTINTGIATLDSGWGGPSGTYDYVAGNLEYPLAADVMRLVSPMRCFESNRQHDCQLIHEVDPERMYGESPLAMAEAGIPEAYTRVTEQMVRFNRYAPPPAVGGYTRLYRVEYDYIRRPPLLTAPGTIEEPLVPWEWRRVLADWALYWLLIDKNDSRADTVGLSAKAGLQGMADENIYQRRSFDRSPAFGHLYPRSNECAWRPR